MKICVTGHRPNKLDGYDLKKPFYGILRELFKLILITLGCREAITGMALGCDTVFAQAVLELKDAGYDIKLICAIPCLNHSSKWVKESKDEYDAILARADEVVIVTEEVYRPELMQIRNKWMADRADMAIALFDGTNGGTKNCVDYIKSLKKKLMVINPGDIKETKTTPEEIRASYECLLKCLKAA